MTMLTWYVTVVDARGSHPAKPFDTKREALKFIAGLGDISRISRTVVPGGRNYTVTPKAK
jgi:hypothetical protein